jgi:hypothetical protein
LTTRETGYFDWAERTIIQPDQKTNAYGSSEGAAVALYHALVVDRVAGGQKAEERHKAILSLPVLSYSAGGLEQFKKLGWIWLSKQERYYFRWAKWRLRNQNFQLMGKPLGQYFQDTIPDDADEYTYTEVYSCFDRTCKGKRLMTTAKGYLGWAPDNMFGDDIDQVMRGDLIAILYGCSTPVAIRPFGDQFQVLGEAYIQGLMEGEALEFLKNGECKERDFVFC